MLQTFEWLPLAGKKNLDILKNYEDLYTVFRYRLYIYGTAPKKYETQQTANYNCDLTTNTKLGNNELIPDSVGTPLNGERMCKKKNLVTKSWVAFTCYLCFSCFCFSFSSFLSLGCWWRVAWRHSRVQLLQANKQHSGHMSRYLAMQNIATVKRSQTRNRKTTKCTTFDLHQLGIQRQCLASVQWMDFMQHLYTVFSPLSLDNDVILNWNKPH